MNTVPRIVNGLYVTECVSFPRSGHHMLQAILQRYFGGRMVYSEPYTHPETVIDKCPGTNYQKNHDFDLCTPISRDRKYLVQVRDPLDALPSYWEFLKKHGSAEESEQGWRLRMVQASMYWAMFVSKWVFRPVPNRLVVRYRDLVESPCETVTGVIKFLDTEQDVVGHNLDVAMWGGAWPEPKPRWPLRYCDGARPGWRYIGNEKQFAYEI